MPTWPVRSWRMQPWNPSPLMRVSDRVEGFVRILAVLVLLIAVPTAAAAGTAAYSSASERIRGENATKVVVTGTIVGTPVRVSAPVADRNATVRDQFEAQVSWTHDGKSGTATVGVPDAAERGQPAPVWLDPDGKPTAPPEQSSAAAVHGIGVGIAVLLEIWCGALAVVGFTIWALNHRRHIRLDREWRQFSHSTGQGSL
ncbi:Rv1733c family protein [Nocardia sp. CA-084685]|uniref:Rv1733c family protein n=1 Tax=Nocardia sp. CA-084685 TaxID=3239970 RepID=UPI003D970623